MNKKFIPPKDIMARTALAVMRADLKHSTQCIHTRQWKLKNSEDREIVGLAYGPASTEALIADTQAARLIAECDDDVLDLFGVAVEHERVSNDLPF